MNGNKELEMEIFKLKDKISALEYNLTKIEIQFHELRSGISRMNNQIKDVLNSIEGDNK